MAAHSWFNSTDGKGDQEEQEPKQARHNPPVLSDVDTSTVRLVIGAVQFGRRLPTAIAIHAPQAIFQAEDRGIFGDEVVDLRVPGTMDLLLRFPGCLSLVEGVALPSSMLSERDALVRIGIGHIKTLDVYDDKTVPGDLPPLGRVTTLRVHFDSSVGDLLISRLLNAASASLENLHLLGPGNGQQLSDDAIRGIDLVLSQANLPRLETLEVRRLVADSRRGLDLRNRFFRDAPNLARITCDSRHFIHVKIVLSRPIGLRELALEGCRVTNINLNVLNNALPPDCFIILKRCTVGVAPYEVTVGQVFHPLDLISSGRIRLIECTLLE